MATIPSRTDFNPMDSPQWFDPLDSPSTRRRAERAPALEVLEASDGTITIVTRNPTT